MKHRPSSIFKDERCLLRDGVEYLLGSANSLVIACEKCGDEHFRDENDYFRNPEWHKCFACKDPKQQMVPIRFDELISKWEPFWLSLGHEVNMPQLIDK